MDFMADSCAPSTTLGGTPAPPHVLTASLKVLRCSVKDDDAPKAGRGEVTPLLPVVEKCEGMDIIVQEGWYKSFFVRVLTDNVTPKQLEEFLKECEDKQLGAVYAALPERLSAHGPVNGQKWLDVVYSRGYKHHHYHKPTGEQIYYVWGKNIPDMVPEYATSIEGGGVLVVSQDEKEVLLVRNRGWTDSHWARPGGAVNAGESCLEAALRECKEETQVALDDNFPVQLAASYNLSKARDQRINDHFMLFVAKAVSKDLRTDENEVFAAEWFDVAKLTAAWNDALSALGEGEQIPRSIKIEGAKFGSMELLGLDRFQKKLCPQRRIIGGMEIY